MTNQIWQVENWGNEEFIEQAMAEMAFAKWMGIQHVLDPENLSGNVAGYRVRRVSTDYLVLAPSDSDDDIFVAVKVESTTTGRVGMLGWLRGSEGKLPQFYQRDRWTIPLEALQNIATLREARH